VFFRDRVDFNEQLATLVGWQGAVLYQEAAHGPDSPQARRAREALEDARREAAFLEDAHRRLQAFYDLPLSPEEKLAGRGAVFEEIRRDARSLAGALAAPGRSPLEDRPWNNASLLALWRYRYDTGGLEALHVRLGRDLRRLIAWVKEWQAQGWDPREMMAQGAPGP
jgi:predicted aminopeptidase